MYDSVCMYIYIYIRMCMQTHVWFSVIKAVSRYQMTHRSQNMCSTRCLWQLSDTSSCICPMVLTTLCLQRIWTSKEFGWWEQPRVWISKIGLDSKMDRKSSKLCKNESRLSGTEVGIFTSLLEWIYHLVGPLSHNAFCCGSRFCITDSLQESRWPNASQNALKSTLPNLLAWGVVQRYLLFGELPVPDSIRWNTQGKEATSL